MYTNMVKMVSIDISEFAAIILAILFYYFKMSPFVNAAVSLGYVNGQTVSYALFAVLLILLPVVLLFHTNRINKAVVLRYIFYSYAAVIISGTIFDIVRYNWFIDYTYIEGDALFVNLMWNIPNIAGVIVSLAVAFLYLLLGKQIKRSRTKSYILYIIVFIASHLPAYAYSYISSGSMPRNTYLQKNIYVMAIQLLILVAFSIAATSRSIWTRRVWN